ncbi:PREDICTED: uncharacterized membrane protein At1g16860-like isoform X2 [Nelumbo nucifera]|uniref:Uncharacterized membrane protein At1g16860-like isoform X2 n=1 Tax=Nelumbo nucifera TaxID=4432 RepID=A0A1U7ZS29_NELNU|nr:PREDICTED: uncharacterized membrane protein At1g16860-like isoform X2 [Nelumbo nucifera]
MNDLSNALRERRHCCSCRPIPTPVVCLLIPLFFIVWNTLNWRRNGAILLFLDSFPDSDLRTATHGQLVKITGFASCGSLSLESSYEKVHRCTFTSTLLYEYKGFSLKKANVNNGWFQWRVAYAERFSTDFYITDMKSGIRVMVKAGYGSKVIPLIVESTLVNTTNKHRVLSSYLRKWLVERNLSAEARLLHLEEGYIKEGSSVTVMGVLHKNSDITMIVQPPEIVSTGCLWRGFLLPVDVNGLILRVSETSSSPLTNPCSGEEP